LAAADAGSVAPAPTAERRALGLVVFDRSRPQPPGEAWPEAEQRTRAELAAVGLSVIDVDVPETDPSKPTEALGRATRSHGAVAGVRIVRFAEPPGADIWIVDEVTGKTSSRHVATSNLPSSEALAVVALAVVELLNASLLELRAAHRTRGSAKPTEAVLRLVDSSLEPRPEEQRFGLRGAAAMIGSPGGYGLMTGPAAAFGWGLHPSWLAEAELLITATQSQFEGAAGRAQVGFGIGRLQLLMRKRRNFSRCSGLARACCSRG
jgi:hypothetical protein